MNAVANTGTVNDAPLLEKGRPGLIPFIMAGDPSLEATELLASALIEEGAVALEIGVPFSDALADGPVIQAAAARALKNRVSLEQVFTLVARLRARHPKTPLILFSYFNPIFRFGVDAYAARAQDAGVTGTLVVDLPPEEAKELRHAHAARQLKMVFLASPTTSPERVEFIDEASTGFIYYVSRTGVTGVQSALSGTLHEEISRLRQATRRPIAVGFGISNGAQAAEVAKIADAVVVGSAFVKLIEAHLQKSPARGPTELEQQVRGLARELIAGIEAVRS